MSALIHSGFHIRPVRKASKSTARETLLTIHQNKLQEMVDVCGNIDVSAAASYYLKNGSLLMRYYDIISADASEDSGSGSGITTSLGTSTGNVRSFGDEPISRISKFFQQSSSTNTDSTDSFPESSSVDDTSKGKLDETLGFPREIAKLKKSDIYELYQANNNKNFIPEKYCKKSDDIRVCSSCGAEATLIPNDAILFCESCGWEERILIDVDLPGMKEQSKDSSYFNYRKINHFNEWLAQFQAKETTDIPAEVYDLILLELRKEKRRNIADLKPKTLREILKRLNMNKYYEHIPHIMNRLNGIPPPRLSPETEEVLRSMFRDIQTPFMKYCPPWRKNFLSYSYVLHKFCKILGKDEFLSCFPLLKSREKLYEMDKVWKMICEDLGWEFHRSI